VKSKVAPRSEDLLADEFLSQFKVKEGRTLIVGSKLYAGREDRRKRYPDAVGVDMQGGKGVDLVCDLEEDRCGKFAHIECCSVLEHSKRPWLLAKNIEKMLEPDGTLYLRVPWVWRFHGYPNDYFRFSIEGVKSLFPGIQWKKLTYLAEDRYCDRAPKYAIDGKRAFGRCEVMGFGCKS
jgi:hypothetical protein